MKTCSKCDRPHQARGLCQSHYTMAHRSGEIVPLENSSRGCLLPAHALVVLELATGDIVPREVIAARTGLHPNTVSDAVYAIRRLFGANIVTTWPGEGYELCAPLPGFGR